MHAEGVPPIESMKSGQERDDTAPESPERRKLIKAIGRFFVGGAAAAVAGLGTDDAEAGRKQKAEIEKPKNPKKEIAKSREDTLDQEQARQEYEKSLRHIQLDAVHREQGKEVKVEDIMQPPLAGEHEPTQEQLHAMLGEQNGLVVIPSFHRALLYKYDQTSQTFTLLKEMPVGTGRHKDATEGEYFTPRGFFKANWKKELHLSKFSTAFKKMQELPRRLWKNIKEEAYDMPYTVNITGEGVATHGSSRFSLNSKGEETLILDRSHGCINMRKEDAQLVYETLADKQSADNHKDVSTIAILSDIESVTNKEIAQVMKEELSEDAQAHTRAIRTSTTQDIDTVITAQPDVANYVAQIRRNDTMALANKAVIEGVIHAPLQRDAQGESIYVSGVKIGERALLLAKDGALRVFTVPQLLGREATAPQTHIASEVVQAEREGRLHGIRALVASRGFETGVDIGNDTYTNGLPTFLVDPEQSSVLKTRVIGAAVQQNNRAGLQHSIEQGEVLVGILRPDEFNAFVDKHSIDRGEPVYVQSTSIPHADGTFDAGEGTTLLAGLVLDVLPLPNVQGNAITDTDGQWGMVLISKPSATAAAMAKLDK